MEEFLRKVEKEQGRGYEIAFTWETHPYNPAFNYNGFLLRCARLGYQVKVIYSSKVEKVDKYRLIKM